MTSLPGDRARSARLVTTPYPTATSAHTSATTTPWSDRKSDKGDLSESVQTNTKAAAGSRAAARAVAESIGRARGEARSLARDPEAAGALRRARTLVLGGLLARGGLLPGRLPRRLLGVDELEPRERVAHRSELLGVALLEQRNQRARAL